MKRARFTLLVVVVAMVLMGAGYAAWTQTFDLKGTVETGQLFVKIEDQGSSYEVLDNEDNTIRSGTLDAEENYLDLSVDSELSGEGEDATLSELKFELNDMYPGTRVISEIHFTNQGTLETVAGVGEMMLEPEGGNELWNDLEISVNGNVAKGDTAEAKLQHLGELIASEIGDLEPEETETITIVQELPRESGNDTQELSLTWSASIEFQQYNLAN